MSEELKEITRLCGVIKEKDKEIERLNNIINKAIEYIEENSDDMHTYISQVLTDILKGSDKE